MKDPRIAVQLLDIWWIKKKNARGSRHASNGVALPSRRTTEQSALIQYIHVVIDITHPFIYTVRVNMYSFAVRQPD